MASPKRHAGPGATVAEVGDERARVPAGVLTPVVRRRRRRVGPKLVLAVVLLAAVGAVAFHEWPSHRSAAAAAPRTPAPPHKTVSHERRPAAPLLTGPARTTEAFRPPIAARGAIAVDAGTGAVLWEHRAHRRLPIASTTKIMTATLALERLGPDALVEVPPAATRVPLVREGLRPHERVKAWKL